MILFQSERGRVVKLRDPAAQCRIQNLSSIKPGIGYVPQLSIITSLNISQRINVQFLHTVGAGIYIYTFGDRIGQMQLSGLSFSCTCPGDSPGLEQMYTWFKSNRASVRREPVRVTIGKTPIEGFVIEFGAAIVDAASGLSQWNLSLATLPENLDVKSTPEAKEDEDQ